MKKKTFYQTNIFWQLFCFIFFVAFIIFSIVGVQLIIGIINKWPGENVIDKIISVISLILYFISTLLVLKWFVQFEHNNIHLTNEKIYMNDDWNNEKNKIQYYSEVKFVDIELVDIIWTKRNFKGRLIRSNLLSALVVKPYLSIKTKNGEVDFLAKKDGNIKYIQVTYEMEGHDNTIEREFGAYKSIEDNYPKYVISLDKIDLSRDGIIHLNLIDFLLSEEF